MKTAIRFLLLLVLASGSGLRADDWGGDWDFDAPVTPGFPKVTPVVDDTEVLVPGYHTEALRNSVSDLAAALKFQTPVRNQARRGTCAIFSTVGGLESFFLREDRLNLDLSESYLEYLIMSRVAVVPAEGSSPDTNIEAIARYGMIEETVWPYEEYDWTEPDIPETEKIRADQVCEGLKNDPLKRCLLGHMPPDRDPYAEQSLVFKEKHRLDVLRAHDLFLLSKIKESLDQQRGVILSVTFFYGAWNHRRMEEYGIGRRNLDLWGKGIVGVPTSQDIALSRQHPAGHSIVIVGYNDEEKVYYFKNSWGSHSFGVVTELPGYGHAPGYGSIPYAYAHQYGTFYLISRAE